MPYKDKDQARASRMRSYYKHREKELSKQREYDKERNQTKERKDYKKQYHIDNPHVMKISSWKQQGMILREDEDWESIYIEYVIANTCEDCDRILTEDKTNTSTRKCLDHDHHTGFIRGIICHACNSKRG